MQGTMLLYCAHDALDGYTTMDKEPAKKISFPLCILRLCEVHIMIIVEIRSFLFGE